MNIKIVVATHKRYCMPADKMYLPIQVGKAMNKLDLYQGDNTGDNISRKNPNYCELTAMYWAWKNLEADYIGLVHYRRLFCMDSWFKELGKSKKHKVMTTKKAEQLLSQYDAVLPNKRHYWIETLKSHYEHTHYIKDLMAARTVIARHYPLYLAAFDEVMERRSAHMFNMFIMRKDIFEAYANWLFSVLFHVESDIDISDYSPFQARVFGFISELLLDVWLKVNTVHYVEMPVLFMESEHWPRKIGRFLLNKFFPRAQEHSAEERKEKIRAINAR